MYKNYQNFQSCGANFCLSNVTFTMFITLFSGTFCNKDNSIFRQEFTNYIIILSCTANYFNPFCVLIQLQNKYKDGLTGFMVEWGGGGYI